jgi:site-specific recombinase XerD
VGATASGTAPRSCLHIGMGCAPKNSARFAGLKSISSMVACTSTAQDGIESVHPLHGPELRALRPLQGKSPYVFTTEAGTPVTTSWFLRMVQRTGKAAKLPFAVHPHMLRHSTGYKLANDGHDTRSLAHYLGHRNLQSTARYTALAPDRFAKFWQD